MKIGTVPKITAGVIGIAALIFIGFIGVRQMTAPNVEQRVYLIPEKEEIASTPNKTEQLVAQTDATPDTEIRKNQPQVISEEMDPVEELLVQLEEAEIEDLFAQFEEADTQSAETESQRDANGNISTEAGMSSAEDVMSAYVDALRNVDFVAMRSLSTGHAKEGLDSAAADGFPIMDPDEPIGGLKELPKDLPIEMREMAEQEIQNAQQQVRSAEPQLRSMMLKYFSQREVVRSEYVDDEFHFELGGPTPEIPEIPGIEISTVAAPNELYKMRKENGTWRVYDNETLD